MNYQSSYQLLFILIEIICLILLLSIIYSERRLSNKPIENRLFLSLIFSIALVILIEIISRLIEFYCPLKLIIINLILNSFYMLLCGLIGFLWLLYAEYKSNNITSIKTWQTLIKAIPLTILFIVCITSLFNKCLFYIDENNIYHRGSLYIIQPIVSYSYVAWATIEMLLKAVKEKKRYKRNDCILLSSFAILPAIGGILEIFNYGIPSTWAGAALSTVVVYIYFQNGKILLDGLTELNNRRSLDEFLYKKVTSYPKLGSHLYFIMIDIDNFKNINDFFGHLKGDFVIIQFGKIISSVVINFTNCFAARYGGDEFAIICESKNIETPKNIVTQIKQELEIFNSKKDFKFSLTASYGISTLSEDDNYSVEELISRADKELYINKTINKKN